jgi:formylglycine-generating enzyme required for sulfatase activity
LDDFFIDKYEVTNVMYKACVEDNKCEPPKDTSSWTRTGYFDNSNYDNYPVIYVTWSMAKTYCEWRQARLPSEAEWEKAARGTDQRIYPWGAEIDATFANYGESVGDTTPVGSYEKGKSYYGVYDMAGNVWEWVADWYSDSYYQNAPSSNPLGPDSGELRVLRGGSKDMKPALVRTTARGSYDPNGIASDFGFRCAKDADG